MELLRELMEIESPSGREEKIRNFIMKYLEELGYKVLEWEYFIAANPRKKLIVATHMDTINAKPKIRYNKKYFYGVGVCDPKASIASILMAAKSNLDYTIAFFCDEEEGGKGSRQFVKEWKWGEMAIVMEPTNLEIASKHFGGFDLEIEITGDEFHPSVPLVGFNAIERCCEIIMKIKSLMNATPLKIQGGGDLYVTPRNCYLKLDILLDINERLDEVIKKLEFINNFGKYKITDAYEGFVSRDVVKVIEEALKMSGLEIKHTTMPSWTDAQNLKEKFDVVVWGPGDLSYCHTNQEKIGIRDIQIASKVLVNLNKVDV
ncbi:acetylornithine deacetylase [Archaeoglobales archaeon ex4484_92]|nr:MAG: acetylornithine deacetylase [Archaeoglobales archaeon ex4484_92]